jgi:hypothetical protein
MAPLNIEFKRSTDSDWTAFGSLPHEAGEGKLVVGLNFDSTGQQFVIKQYDRILGRLEEGESLTTSFINPAKEEVAIRFTHAERL